MTRLCISTLDPEVSGGVSTMAGIVYEIAENAGYDPYLAYNKLNLDSDIRPWDVPWRGMSVTPTETTVAGMEAKYTSRVLPEFEFWHYVLNGDAWREMISEADICFAVGGNNQCAQPFVRAGRTFSCWIATPMWADRTDRVRGASLPLKVRDLLSKPLLRRIERRIFLHATNVFTLSGYTAQAIEADYGSIIYRSEVLPFPIDTETFSPDECKEPTNQVLFVGRYDDPRKNATILIDAVAHIQDSVPDVSLRLVGAEPPPKLRSRVDELGLGDVVKFINYIPNNQLPKYYRKADVFVIPSNQEGLAIVGLEAMACGTPVVATKCGGPEDYVIDGQNGVLVPRDDPKAMAQAISSFLENDDRRRAASEAARTEIEQRFSQSQLADEFVSAFEALERESSGNK